MTGYGDIGSESNRHVLGKVEQNYHWLEGREDISSPFGGLRDCTLNLPETVKVISAQSIRYVSGIMSEDDQDDLVHLVKINADEDNPYYSSEDGVLYSKDKKKLLFVYFDYGWQSYSVPRFCRKL